MSSISIIGLGNMASALADRALAGGNAVEIIGRDPAKAKELAAALGGATVGTASTAPAGDIVILAVPYASAAAVVERVRGRPTRQGRHRHHQPRHPRFHRALSPPRAVPARRRSPRPPPPARMSSRRSTPCSPTFWRPAQPRVARWTCSSPATTRRQRPMCRCSSRASDCARWTPGSCPWRGHWRTRACCSWASIDPLRQAHQLRPRRQHSQLSAPAPPLLALHHVSRSTARERTPTPPTLRRTVTCAFSSLAGPAMPVRTSSPSSSPPGTRSPAWPGRTRPRRPSPRSARRCVAATSRISTGSRRRPRTPTASSTSRTGKTCSRPAGLTPWPPRSSRSCSRSARHSREPESRWSPQAV